MLTCGNACFTDNSVHILNTQAGQKSHHFTSTVIYNVSQSVGQLSSSQSKCSRENSLEEASSDSQNSTEQLVANVKLFVA